VAKAAPAGRHSSAADRIRGILDDADTNLHQVSEATRRPPYGDRTDYFIPQWFYSELERGIAPHICQIVAFSQITGIRFVDWMAVFGYRLDDIPRWQVSLPRERPVRLSSVTYDKNAMVDWLDARGIGDDALQQTQPLSELIGALRRTTAGAIEQRRTHAYLYVKVGDADASLYPRVGAGSVLRIDPTRADLDPPGHPPTVFAVEWRHGLLLTYLKAVSGRPGGVVLPPRYPALELVPGRDLTILGAADCELRPLRDEIVTTRPGRRSPLMRSRAGTREPTVGNALRRYRERAGLNLRQAHELTVRAGELIGDRGYAVSQSCLFRYELASTLPRQIPAILSLCIVYGISLWELLEAAGVQVDPACGAPPDEAADALPGSWRRVLAEVPLFIRDAAPALLRQNALTLDDVYTCGTRLRSHNPLFQGAVFLSVDRRQRNVERVKLQARHREPMFLVRAPSGQYLCGACSVQGDILTVQPRLQTPTTLAPFERNDVEVVGRVTGVVRLLDAPA